MDRGHTRDECRVGRSEPAGRAAGRAHKGTDMTASVTSSVHDPDAVRADLTPLFDGDRQREIMALYVTVDNNGKEKKRVVSINTPHLEDALAFVAKHDAGGTMGLYVGTNLLKHNTKSTGRAESGDVAELTGLFFDLDVVPAKRAKRASIDDELGMARDAAGYAAEFCKEHGHTGGAFRIGTSGNGYYLIYRLAAFPNDDQHRAIIADAISAISIKISRRFPSIKVDSTGDPIRVRRISGTVNRSHGGERLCRLGSNNDADCFPVDVLLSIGAECASPSTSTPSEGPRPLGTVVLTEDEMGSVEDAWRLYRKHGNRHDSGLWLAAYLAHKGVSRSSAAIVFRRIVCDDNDIDDRTDGFDRTFDRYEQGENVEWKAGLEGQVVDRLNAVARIIYDRTGPGLNRSEQTGSASDDSNVDGTSTTEDTETDDDNRAGPDATESRRSVADQITDVVTSKTVESWNDGSAGYVTVTREGHHEHYRCESASFRNYAAYVWYKQSTKGAKAESLKEVALNMNARAIFSEVTHTPARRIGFIDDAVYLDPMWDDWRVLKIASEGWKIIPSSECPVKFIRGKESLPLPEPTHGGSLDSLFDLFPMGETERMFVEAFLLSHFQEGGTKPILGLTGSEGTHKTTLAGALMAIVDPTTAAIKSLPKSEERWALAGAKRLSFTIDNLTHITTEVANTLARMMTGFDESKRENYTDDEESSISAHASVILTSITPIVSMRPDVADRALPVTLPKVHRNIKMKEIQRRIEEGRPSWLGAILDAVSCWLGCRDGIEDQLDSLPRLADLAVIVESASESLGFRQGAFIAAVKDRRADAYLDALENYPIFAVMTKLLTSENDYQWEGTATSLLHDLNYHAPDSVKRSKRWPTASNALSGQLNDIATAARIAGYTIEWTRTNRRRGLMIGRIQDEGRASPVTSDRPPENVRQFTHAHSRGDGVATARAWLFDRLKGGSQPVDVVNEQAREEDISPHDLNEARVSLGVATDRDGNRNYWRLPSKEAS